MDTWIESLTTRLLWADDVDTAKDAFHEIAAGIGVESICYAAFGAGPGLPYVDTTYPQEWVERYVSKGYSSFDPVVLEAQRNRLPYAWRFLFNRQSLTPQQRTLFAEAHEVGLRDGLTIPFHANNTGSACSLGIFSMAFPSPQRLKDVMAAQPRIRLLGIYYHAAIERLMEENNPGATPDGLSSHECQCLSWAAEGRSLWDISANLRLPESNVAGMLRSAREKLGVNSTAEAVAHATAHGLLR